MIKRVMNLSGVTPLNRMQIEHLVHLAGRFSSRIIFEHKTRTINGKSMLGLLSMGVTGKDPVTMITDGEDEEEAAEEIAKLLDTGVAPPKEAGDAMELMQKVKKIYADLLPDQLVGIYLHGSLSAGCFQWERSDIDFIAVVKKPLPIEKKIALIENLYMLKEDAPPEGFDMTVLTEDECRSPSYPVRYDLRFAPRWNRDYERDARGFCERTHGEDPLITIYFLTLHAMGIPILGPSIPRVFGQVKREDALGAMRMNLADAGERLHEMPVPYVLNLCRAIAYLREDQVYSKRQGGEWALKHMAHSHQAVIQAALNAYHSGRDMFYDLGQAEDFCYEAMEELNRRD